MTKAFMNKSMKLSIEFDSYLARHPQLFVEIPNKAYIIITVEGDEKFNQNSIAMVKSMKRKQIVEAHKSSDRWSLRPLALRAA